MAEGKALVVYDRHVYRCVERMAADDTETEMEYINMAVENSMLDDYSLYVYLADSDAE